MTQRAWKARLSFFYFYYYSSDIFEGTFATVLDISRLRLLTRPPRAAELEPVPEPPGQLVAFLAVRFVHVDDARPWIQPDHALHLGFPHEPGDSRRCDIAEDAPHIGGAVSHLSLHSALERGKLLVYECTLVSQLSKAPGTDPLYAPALPGTPFIDEALMELPTTVLTFHDVMFAVVAKLAAWWDDQAAAPAWNARGIHPRDRSPGTVF